MKIIGPHGGYRKLRAYQLAEAVHDGTVAFTNLYVDRRSRTVDQMVQAARSGKQNIAEGSRVSGTSKKLELKLVGVARASLEELLIDYEDYLRQHQLELWPSDHEKAAYVRAIRHDEAAPYAIYQRLVELKGAENAANTLICMIHQTNFLLDKLLLNLESEFSRSGGVTERIYRARKAARSEADQSDRSDQTDRSDRTGES